MGDNVVYAAIASAAHNAAIASAAHNMDNLTCGSSYASCTMGAHRRHTCWVAEGQPVFRRKSKLSFKGTAALPVKGISKKYSLI